MGPFFRFVGFERLCRSQSAPMPSPRSSEMPGVAPLDTTSPQGVEGKSSRSCLATRKPGYSLTICYCTRLA
jgi:hypothetical protein